MSTGSLAEALGHREPTLFRSRRYDGRGCLPGSKRPRTTSSGRSAQRLIVSTLRRWTDQRRRCPPTLRRQTLRSPGPHQGVARELHGPGGVRRSAGRTRPICGTLRDGFDGVRGGRRGLTGRCRLSGHPACHGRQRRLTQAETRCPGAATPPPRTAPTRGNRGVYLAI